MVSIDLQVQHREFTLERDGEPILTTRLAGPDTIIIDEPLQPNTTYRYKMRSTDSSVVGLLQSEVVLTTMDTTNHDVLFSMNILGEPFSIVYRAAVISSDDIWAVGSLLRNDSTGQPDHQRYNLVHWDGNDWEYIQLSWDCHLVYPNCGGDPSVVSEGTAIAASGPDDIWVAAGVLHHFDGSVWSPWGDLGYVSAKKIWISDPSDIYLVGDEGLAAHFNGVRWTRLQTGTTLDIQDVFGSTDPFTGLKTVLCIASENNETILLRIDHDPVSQVADGELATEVHGFWFDADTYYYMVGSGIHQKRGLNSSGWTVSTPGEITSYYSEAIHGTGINDVFVVGDFMEVVHHNGMNWTSYWDQIPVGSGVLADIIVTDNLIVAVGFSAGGGVVITGTR